MKTKRPPTRDSAAQLQRLAQERADEQARRIPWIKLYDTRRQYVDWQEVSLWVRSILESEGKMPEWLGAIVEQRCPGFLEADSGSMPATRPLALRLEDWIDEHVFAFARSEGWLDAIAYYAVRDPRYQRAEVCWAECVEKWKRAKPIRYPSFEEWKEAAVQCDPTAHLVPKLRRLLAPINKVTPERLAGTINRYVEWEAIAYWARPALEGPGALPAEVVREFELRCPEFLEALARARSDESARWQQLLYWIQTNFAPEATDAGWRDAILHLAATHPRSIRTIEYADYCDELWGGELPKPYPSFPEWRREADAYVETTAAE